MENWCWNITSIEENAATIIEKSIYDKAIELEIINNKEAFSLHKYIPLTTHSILPDLSENLNSYQKNKGYQKYHQKYYQEHKEAIKQKSKKYRQEHKEAIKQKSKKYRQEHKEAIKKRTNEYYQEHRQEHKEAIKKKNRENYLKRKYKEINKDNLTKEILTELYWNKKMSLPEISSILDIPQQSSYYRMWKWKVPRRNDSERSKLTSKKNPALLEKLKEGREKGREKAIELNTRKHEYGMNEIKRLYTEEFLSYQDIAETLNNTISHQSIKTWLSEVCTLRKPGEAILLKWFKKNNVTINEFIESVDINGHSIIIKNYKISKEKMKKLYSVALKYRKDNKQLN